MGRIKSSKLKNWKGVCISKPKPVSISSQILMHITDVLHSRGKRTGSAPAAVHGKSASSMLSVSLKRHIDNKSVPLSVLVAFE